MTPFKLMVPLFKAQFEFEACREYAPIRDRALQHPVDWTLRLVSYWKSIPVSIKLLALLSLVFMGALGVLVDRTTPAAPHIGLLPY